MWLSKIEMLDRHFAGGRSHWDDAGWVHRRVMALFGQATTASRARAELGILYRIEPQVNNGQLLIQSTAAPEAYDGLRTISLDGLLGALREGQHCGVALTYNLVQSKSRAGRKRHLVGANLPHEDTEEANRAAHLAVKREAIQRRLRGIQLDWDICTLTPNNRSLLRDGKKVPLFVEQLVGVGVVTDVQSLMGAVESGIGKAKSFGCGMLSVFPLAQ